MNRHRLIEILETYRPGEGMEADPDVQDALELAASDPELGKLQRQIIEFDEVFSGKLRQVEVPQDLQERILEAARVDTSSFEEELESKKTRSKVIWWFHPAAFGAAAAITILFALSFTFWDRPVQEVMPLTISGDPVSTAAHSLYASLNPAFKSRQGLEVYEYLKSKGNGIPASLPGNIAWDQSFACDVVEINGAKVSIVCFKAPDNSKSMHLFTFHRSDFPDLDLSPKPQIRQDGDACCATWGTEDKIHVLYSDKGESNLLAVLDI